MYYVYILASKTLVLYIGMTNDLSRRLAEHKLKIVPGFTSKYNVDRLLYYETFNSPSDAIYREKQLKGWTRAKNIDKGLESLVGGNCVLLRSRDPSLRSG